MSDAGQKLERILFLTDARQFSRDKWDGFCPAHDDKAGNRSLRISRKGDKVLVFCFGGCSQRAVLEALAAAKAWESKPISADERRERRTAKSDYNAEITRLCNDPAVRAQYRPYIERITKRPMPLNAAEVRERAEAKARREAVGDV